MSDTKPFLHRPHRELITREPDPSGRWSSQFPDMIGYRNQGGGKVPADFGWHSNPKQWQEELTPENLAAHFSSRVLPKNTLAEPAALPEGAKTESR